MSLYTDAAVSYLRTMKTTNFTHEIFDTRLNVIRSRHKSEASALKRKAIWDKSRYADHSDEAPFAGQPVQVIVRPV